MTSFIKSLVSLSSPMCENCGIQPKYGAFDYCGKTCAAEAERKKKAAGYGGRGPNTRNTPSSSATSFGRGGFPAGGGSYASAAGGPNHGADNGMCEVCGQRPKSKERGADGRFVVHRYCSRGCADMAGRQASTAQGPLAGLPAVTKVTAMDPNHPLAAHIYAKFVDRWDSETVPAPAVIAIYRINLPVKFYNRFDGALEMNEGAEVLTTYYGGQAICEIGCQAEPEGTLCNWESCSICLAMKTAFNTLEFGEDAYDGTYGAGIYTHFSPAMAHRWTLGKAPEVTNCRAIIQCRVVRAGNKEPGQPHAAYIDESGRVYCKDKRAIIPTHLIIYDPTPRAPERRQNARP